MRHRVFCSIIRGGTSRGVFLRGEDLPRDQEERDALILRVFGSPDPRQIDGLGGADPLTSKVCVVSRAAPENADIHYLFGQVGIREPVVDTLSICGNLSSAVALYAVDSHFADVVEPITRVDIYAENIKSHIIAEVPVANGVTLTRGAYEIAGVPGTGARIALDFSPTLRDILPTGKPVDVISVGGVEATVSLVNAGNPTVFVSGSSVGMTGHESVAEIDSNAQLSRLLEQIRGHAAYRFGLIDDPENSRLSPAAPLLAVVGEPADYQTLGGRSVTASQTDLTARMQYMQTTHKAYAVTGTIATGVATVIPGTVVNQVVRPSDEKLFVRIGHPSGVIECEVEHELDNRAPAGVKVKKVAVGRTARTIMEGWCYL